MKRHIIIIIIIIFTQHPKAQNLFVADTFYTHQFIDLSKNLYLKSVPQDFAERLLQRQLNAYYPKRVK